MRRLVEHFVRGRPRAAADLDQLTDREREVLALVVRGLSNAAIARHLVIGETTVKTHVTRILAKLALRDRTHAVIYGYETGLVRPGDSLASGPPPRKTS
jgi:DNA-binding NarL/FixJ family response regulator